MTFDSAVVLGLSMLWALCLLAVGYEVITRKENGYSSVKRHKNKSK